MAVSLFLGRVRYPRGLEVIGLAQKGDLPASSLCGPLRISASSAFNGNFNAEDAEIRRDFRENTSFWTFVQSSQVIR